MPGQIDKQKQQTLEENGYVYNFRRMIYVNHSTKKVFSYEAIRDHDLNWIKSRITENNMGEWMFYFDSPPSDAVKSELLRDIGRNG